MSQLETSENPNLPDIPRAGFFRRCADYWCASYREIRTTRYEIKTPKIAQGQGLRVAFVSDVHADTRFMSADRIKRVIDQTNALGADLIVLGGDYRAQNNWRMTPLPLTETVALLSVLHAPLGVVAIMGNHDWLDDPATQVGDGTRPETVAVMRDVGMTVLMNEAMALDHPSGIWLGGLDSQMAFARDAGADDLDKTLQDIPEDTYTILLAHEPDIFAKLANTSPRAPVDLVLSGHTHGGQIKVFGARPVVPSAYGSRYAQGHMQEDGRDLIVSVGLGCTSIPIRFGTVPEIVLVHIQGA